MSKSLIADRKGYLTQPEAAVVLGLTLAQLRHRRRLGILPAPDVLEGSVYYYSPRWVATAKRILKEVQ